MSKRLAHIILGIILVIGLVVRLIYLHQVAEYPNFTVPYAGLDAALYHGLAKNLASGDLSLGKEVYYYSPLYAYFLGGLYALFGDSNWVARLANVGLGVLTIGLVYLFSLRFFRSTAVALIAALGTALYGPFLLFDTSSLKRTFALFLAAASLYLVSRADEKGGVIPWLNTGLILGLALNMNGQLSLFVIGLSLWLLFRKYHESSQVAVPPSLETMSRRLSKIGCLLIGVVLTIFPFTIRNYFVAGDVVLTTSTGGIHFYIGNHQGAWGGYTRVKGIRPNPSGHFFDARRLAQKEVGHPLLASQVSSFWEDRAMEFIKEKPRAFLQLLAKKTLLLFNRYEIPNNEDYQYRTHLSPYLSFFPGYGFLLPLGLSGLLMALADFRRLAPLYIFFFSFSLGVIVSIVTWRYRLPLTLVLWPFAAFFVVKIRELAKKRQLVPLILSGLFLLGSWSLARAPLVSERQREKSMRQAEGKMKASEREKHLLRGIRSDPGVPPGKKSALWLELAELRRKQQDIEGAVELLRQALAENPNQPRLWEHLAATLSRLGDERAARKAHENFKKYKFAYPSAIPR